MLKGALFDLDGVIADTAKYHFTAWKIIINKYFNKELPDELEKQTKGVSREDSLKLILNYLNESVSDDIFNNLTIEKNSIYINMLNNISNNDILPGILELIIELKKHNFKLALTSASKNAPYILKKLEIFDLFDTIIDPNTIKLGKPAPDIFLLAAKTINIPIEECIAFEDSIAGIKAINSAGAVSIAIGNKDELKEADIIFDKTSNIDIYKILNI